MKPSESASTRRQFLQSSTAAAIGAAALASTATMVNRAHAAGRDVLKIGLIGCGGRGTGAASQALKADPHVKLTAMGDMFEDRLNVSLQSLQRIEEVADKIDVPADRRFLGFDAYQKVIDSGVDVVLLATPPHFRPMHLEAAINADKHVFAEKPVAVDGPGVRRVLEISKLAENKGLSLVSGLCLRYSLGFQEVVRRIHDGEIGDVHTLEANDYRGTIWLKPRQPEWTDMHWQMRNWYYFTWLSGDFNVEQHVHFLDVCAWAKGDYPVSAVGMGGRQVRTGPEFGNIFDHHSVTYEFADGAKLFSNTRQMKGCANDMSARVVGSKGHANINERITRGGINITRGDDKWVYTGDDNPFYQTEHDELFASIRSGRPINNGEYMAKSTLLAILGRMATYTGQKVTWEEALNSQEDLSPPAYEWGPLATPEIAVPGVTKLV
ncbi:MAG: Gfo/Idh/MocA family oxidoreductase [Pirellulaceae bacterium]